MHIFTCRSTHPPFLFYIWWMLFSCLSSALRPNSIGDSSGLHLSSCRNWCRVHWVTNPHVIQILICYSICTYVLCIPIKSVFHLLWTCIEFRALQYHHLPNFTLSAKSCAASPCPTTVIFLSPTPRRPPGRIPHRLYLTSSLPNVFSSALPYSTFNS